MYLFLAALLLLASLFFVSSFIKRSTYTLLYLVTRKQTAAITLFSLLFYPGVVVHELSHLIAAAVLFVRVKSMTLVPKVIDDKIRGGSVVIEKVDIFRRTLVGIAPLFGGIAILWLVTIYLFPPVPYLCYSVVSNSRWNEILRLTPFAQDDVVCQKTSFEFFQNTEYRILNTIIALYLLFSISSTMYSSKKDLEALLYTLPVLIIISVLAYVLGFQIEWLLFIIASVENLMRSLGVILFLVLGIQGMVFVVLIVVKALFFPRFVITPR